MYGPERNVERDASGRTTKLSVETDVAVIATGEGLEDQAVLLLDGKLPINLADLLEENFGYDATTNPLHYGPLRITIERI